MCCILDVRVTVVTDVKYVFVVPLLSLLIQRILLDLFIYNVFLAETLLFKYYFHSVTFFFDQMVAFHGLFPLIFFAPSCQHHLLNPKSKSPKKKGTFGTSKYYYYYYYY